MASRNHFGQQIYLNDAEFTSLQKEIEVPHFPYYLLINQKTNKIIKEWITISTKKPITCQKCGLKYHEADASHCKSCGNIIFQEFDG